jgi:hypothetical protein
MSKELASPLLSSPLLSILSSPLLSALSHFLLPISVMYVVTSTINLTFGNGLIRISSPLKETDVIKMAADS